jgi:UDP-glucuronate decarboxylase
MMKRILITGGAGFLGSHLCERLLREGNDIICLDNFFTGNKENITHLLGSPHFELIRHDIINPIYLEVDEIYNLACPASPVHYQFNPIKTIKTNVMGVINVLGIAKRTKAKVLQASTSEIYGDPEVNPQNESYWGKVNPTGIRSCYDEGKRAAECLMMDYRRQNSVNTKIVRIFNTYGPRMAINDGRVVSNFIIQALQGKKITVYGDGTHTRSFCYADDLIEGLIMMMNSTDEFYGPVNIGNPEEFTILQLAQIIIKLTKSNSKIEFQPLPADDPVQRKPDISLAKEKIGWTPKIDLEEGLINTIRYFCEVLKIS